MGNVSGAEFYEKAVINQDEKAVKEILTSDPSLASWVDPEGYSVLQRLCAKGDKVKILQLLIKNGAPLDYQEPKHFYTALMLAAKSGNTEFVNCLLKGNANPKLKSKRGKSATELTKAGGIKSILQKAESTFDERPKDEALSNTDSEGASMLSKERALQPEGKNRRPFQGNGKSNRQQSGKTQDAEGLTRQNSGMSGTNGSRKYEKKPTSGRFTGLSSPSGQVSGRSLSLYTEDGNFGNSDDESIGGGYQQGNIRRYLSGVESESTCNLQLCGMEHFERWIVCWHGCCCLDDREHAKFCAGFVCNPYSCYDDELDFGEPTDFLATAISGEEMRRYIFSLEEEDENDNDGGDSANAVNDQGEAVPTKAVDRQDEVIERLEMLEEQVVDLNRSMEQKLKDGQQVSGGGSGRSSDIMMSKCGGDIMRKCIIS